jgi:hypothetical protein
MAAFMDSDLRNDTVSTVLPFCLICERQDNLIVVVLVSWGATIILKSQYTGIDSVLILREAFSMTGIPPQALKALNKFELRWSPLSFVQLAGRAARYERQVRIVQSLVNCDLNEATFTDENKYSEYFTIMAQYCVGKHAECCSVEKPGFCILVRLKLLYNSVFCHDSLQQWSRPETFHRSSFVEILNSTSAKKGIEVFVVRSELPFRVLAKGFLNGHIKLSPGVNTSFNVGRLLSAVNPVYFVFV